MQMKILYLNGFVPRENAPMGGIFVTKRIQALKKKGIEVCPYIYGIEYSEPVEKYLSEIRHIMRQSRPVCRQLDIEYQLRMDRMGFIKMAAARYFPSVYGSGISKMLREDCRKEKPVDLIHLHWVWPVGVGVRSFSKESGIPYVLTCHGSEINITLADPHIRKAMLSVLEDAAAVEFVSEALLVRARELGYSGKNAVVVYNGIDGSIFGNADLESVKKRTVVGFAGNLIPVKGADRLSEIFHTIYKKASGDVEFCVIGDGELRGSLEQQMKQLPVIFTGQVPQTRMAEEFLKMSVLIVPSRREGYSCVIKEAQACGVIPVACNVGGIPEAVAGYGTLVSGTDEEIPGKLADAALEYLEERIQTDRREMADRAKKNTWESMQDLSVKRYQKILATIQSRT